MKIQIYDKEPVLWIYGTAQKSWYSYQHDNRYLKQTWDGIEYISNISETCHECHLKWYYVRNCYTGYIGFGDEMRVGDIFEMLVTDSPT